MTTLFWDVDGVFVDTEPLHFRVWQMLVRGFDKGLSLEEFLPLVGRSGQEIAETICQMKGIADPESFRKSRMQLYGVERGNGIPVILENVVLLRRFQKKIGACIDLRLVLACLCVHEAIQTRSHQHQTAQSSD
jgi:beta-phosphoglucomutase-like phosphatase (HAD superfamily)